MRHRTLRLPRWLASLAAVILLILGGVAFGTSTAYALGPGMACVFNAPHGAGDRGHVGWAYEIGNSGTFVYGAVENPNSDEAITKDGNGNFTDYWTGAATTLGGWSKQGNWSQMMHDFTYQTAWNNSADGWANPGNDTYHHAVNQYARYKCVNVANSAVTAANNAVNQVLHVGDPNDPGFFYRLTGVPGWNCMDIANYILGQYNTQGLPSPQTNWNPNDWYANINAPDMAVGGAGYQVTGTDNSGLAELTRPYVSGVNNSTFIRYVPSGTTLLIVCQTRNGGQADGRTQYGRPFTTWDMLQDGSYVYDWYMNTPTVQTDGYSHAIGIPACVGDGTSTTW
jgi:hypothetical protein